MVPVVLWGDINIESRGTMVIPGIPFHVSVMDYDFTTWGHQGGGVPVEGSSDLGVG